MQELVWFLVAGPVAGSALGFVGAGGPMIGLPIILIGTSLSEHGAPGTNATSISVLAAILAIWAIARETSDWKEGLIFAVPGLIGVYFGTQLGLVFPGRKLIFILGLVIFAAAAWMFWLSNRKEPLFTGPPSPEPHHFRRRAYSLVPMGVIVGWISGFFAVGGGFMIVIALMLGGRLPVRLASQAALIPIVPFTGLEGGRYAMAGHVQPLASGCMLATGILTGVFGIALADRAPRRLLQRVLAGLFVLIGIYSLGIVYLTNPKAASHE